MQEFVEPAVIEQAAYILIAASAFIFIISFLGYCGAIKESRVLLTAYGIFLIIIFALQVCSVFYHKFVIIFQIPQIALILLCTLYKSQADHHSKGFLKSTLSKYFTTGDNKDAVTLSWDLIMAQMSCCGVDGYEDFRTARLFVEKSSAEGLGRQVLACNSDPNMFLTPVTHLYRFLSPVVFSLVILSYSSQQTPPASSAPPSPTPTSPPAATTSSPTWSQRTWT